MHKDLWFPQTADILAHHERLLEKMVAWLGFGCLNSLRGF